MIMSMMGKHLALRLIKNIECDSMVCDFDIILTPVWKESGSLKLKLYN